LAIGGLVDFSGSAFHPLEAVLDSSLPGPFLNEVEIVPLRRAWTRVRFKGSPGRIWNLGLFAPAPSARNDYWLVLGAGIQNQGMRHDRFNPTVTAGIPRPNRSS
jgi:hypothetical protein